MSDLSRTMTGVVSWPACTDVNVSKMILAYGCAQLSLAVFCTFLKAAIANLMSNQHARQLR